MILISVEGSWKCHPIQLRTSGPFRVGFEGDDTIKLFGVVEDINVCDVIDPFTRISKTN